MKEKLVLRVFFILLILSLFSGLLYGFGLLYPYVSPKALGLRIIVVLALPFYLYLILAVKEYRPNLKSFLNLIVLFFLLANLVAIFFGVNWQRSFWGNYERMGGVYQLICFILLYFYILLLGQAKEGYVKQLLQWLVALAALSAFYGVCERLGLPKIVPDQSYPDRISSVFGNPIFFASFLILPTFLAAMFAVSEDRKWLKIYYWVVVAVQLLGVYLSGTRGATVGLAGAIFVGIVLWLIKAGKKLRNYGLMVLAALVIITGALYAVRGHFSPNSPLRRLLTLQDSNSAARLIEWQSAIKGFVARPIFGFGPENYYYVSNKYFNPARYAYDGSWFDKPHNYLLEILDTTGLVGFIGYGAILVLVGMAFYRAFKQELISWLDFCLLFTGWLAYTLQNLFAFDTPAASLAFFVFLGFAGFLWQSTQNVDSAQKSTAKTSQTRGSLPLMGFILGAAAAIYIIFVTDVLTARVLILINKGYAYEGVDPKIASASYQTAANVGFMYDPGEDGTKFAEFTTRIAQDQKSTLDASFIDQNFDSSIALLAPIAQRVNNNPIYWNDLANLYSQKSYFEHTGFDPRAQAAVQKSMEFAPKRVESIFLEAQFLTLQNNIDEAIKVSQAAVAEAPALPDAKWRLALAYNDAGRTNDAVTEAEAALNQGYSFKLVAEEQWLINYYVDQNNYPKVINLYQQAVILDPNDYQLYASLAAAYAKVGDKSDAIAAAQKVLQLSPQSQASVEAFIKSLQ